MQEKGKEKMLPRVVRVTEKHVIHDVFAKTIKIAETLSTVVGGSSYVG
jgi:hypothetical protein